MTSPSLAPIVLALGGDLWAGGRRASVPGPGHSAADRSVSLLLAGRRVVAHSFAGDGWEQVLDDLKARGLVDSQGFVAVGSAPSGPLQAGPLRRDRIAAARRLWDQAREIAGTLSEAHLQGRGLERIRGGALRHHDSAPSAVYADRGQRRPALLAAIRNVDGDLVGVELTYLALSGERARIPVPRKTIGLCPAGSAVRLEPPGPRLLVGEGVASTLSAAQRFSLPAWALLSCHNLARWRPPPIVQFVMIAADRGAVGEAAAKGLARRLAAGGVHGAIRWPQAPHGDWNDALRAASRREREEGRG